MPSEVLEWEHGVKGLLSVERINGYQLFMWKWQPSGRDRSLCERLHREGEKFGHSWPGPDDDKAVGAGHVTGARKA